MKNTSINNPWALAALVATTLSATAESGRAFQINMDFGKALPPGTSGAPDTPTHVGPAAIGEAGDVWNAFDPEFNATAAGLLDTAGVATSVSFSDDGRLLSSFNTTTIEFGSSGHNALMQDYAFTIPDETATLTISGLFANASYTLYLYGVPDADFQGTAFTVFGSNEGSLVVDAGGIADDDGLANPEDFVVFTGLTSAGGEIVYTQAGSGTGISGFSGSNGFQLVVVPEPATTCWAAGVVIGVTGRRRRQ